MAAAKVLRVAASDRPVSCQSLHLMSSAGNHDLIVLICSMKAQRMLAKPAQRRCGGCDWWRNMYPGGARDLNLCALQPFVFYDASRTNNAQFYGLLVDLLPVLLSYGCAVHHAMLPGPSAETKRVAPCVAHTQ